MTGNFLGGRLSEAEHGLIMRGIFLLMVALVVVVLLILGLLGCYSSTGCRNTETTSSNSSVKFIYSEKATKFCEIFPLLLTVQVHLCQKLLFLHQLTNNMTTDCSLNYKFNKYMKIPSSEHGENLLCTEIVLTFRTVQNMFSPCSA